MSSRKRRDKGDLDNNMFEAANTSEIDMPTFEAIDRAGYGSTGPLQLGEKFNVHKLPINKIQPDPKQPRRTIPFAVRETWNGDMDSLFMVWVACINSAEREKPFEIKPLLMGTDKERNEKPQPVEEQLLKIIDLAISIQRDTMTHPITVVQKLDGSFYLETGERRWLAHHLLYQQTGNDKWRKIDAQKVNEFDVWRQAGENNARDDLNAIGRARQFAILLMDLLREQGVTFKEFSTFEHEKDYYAQVEDGEKFRIPHGKSDMILSTMSLKNTSQLRYCRALLRLPQSAWSLADDYNTPMRTLREAISSAGGDEQALLDYIKKAWHSVSPDTKLLPQNGAPKRTITRLTRSQRLMEKAIPRMVTDIKKLKPKERDRIIAELRHQLDALEAGLHA